MTFLVRALAVIRRLYALGTFLGSRFKYLYSLFKFALCRKLTSTCLWYRRGPVVSQQPKPAQSSCTWDNPPPACSLNFGVPAAAASPVPTPPGSSRSDLHPASTSNATTQIHIPDTTPDVGHSILTSSTNRRQGYSASVPAPTTFQVDTIPVSHNPSDGIPLLDRRIDMTPTIPGEFDGGKADLAIPLISCAASPQESVLSPIHLALPHTTLRFPTAFPITPEDISRYMRHSTM